MKFFYFDEHEGEILGRKFTAISGVGISDKALPEVRARFYPILNSILFPDDAISTPPTVRAAPILHGSDLLREYEDTQKVAAVRELYSTFAMYGAEFIRLGYFDDSIDRFGARKEDRVAFCVQSMLMGFEKRVGGLFAFAHEMDRESLRRGFQFADGNWSMLFNLAHLGQAESITVDYRNFVGHYIAAPEDLGCQMADLVGYCAVKADAMAEGFAAELANIHKAHRELFILNQVLELKSK